LLIVPPDKWWLLKVLPWDYVCLRCQEEAGGNPELIAHKETCIITKATALLPRLEAALTAVENDKSTLGGDK
jgi:hypothetical protein